MNPSPIHEGLIHRLTFVSFSEIAHRFGDASSVKGWSGPNLRF